MAVILYLVDYDTSLQNPIGYSSYDVTVLFENATVIPTCNSFITK